MKKFAIILMALVLVVSTAVAFEKPKEDVPLYATYVGNGADKQGGEDFGSAQVIPSLPYNDTGTTVGANHDYTLTTETAGDIVYSFTPAADITIDVDLCASSFDTKVGVLLADEFQVAYNDDNSAYCGQCCQSAVIGVNLTGGVTYYIVVTGFGGNEGEYDLLVTEGTPPPPPPPGDTCDDAVEVDVLSWSVDLTVGAGFNDNYDAFLPCCGSAGPDAFYRIFLSAGETVIITQTGPCDMVLALLDACDGTEVAASDNCCSGATEVITYEVPTTGAYFIVADTYTSGGCPVDITIDGVVATEVDSWGSVKSLFR